MSVISLSEHRSKGDQPDADCVCHDFRTDRVETTYAFVAHYEFDDSQWGLEIWARDMEEAQRKLAAISATGKIDGQLMSRIPA